MTTFDLTENPFFLLKAGPEDDGTTLAAAYEQAVADDPAAEPKLSAAFRALTLPIPRLDAELGWLGAHAQSVGDTGLLGDSESAIDLGPLIGVDLSVLARANIAAQICRRGGLGADRRRSALSALVQLQGVLDPVGIAASVNQARRIAGFPEVTEAMVSTALDRLSAAHVGCAVPALLSLPKPEGLLAGLIEDHAGTERSRGLLTALTQGFEAAALCERAEHEVAISAALERLRLSPAFADAHIESLAVALAKWSPLAQPRQKLMAAALCDEPRAFEIGTKLRETALTYHERRDNIAIALRLIRLARAAFAALPGLSTTLAVDERRLVPKQDAPTQALEAAAENAARSAAARAGFSLPSLAPPDLISSDLVSSDLVSSPMALRRTNAPSQANQAGWRLGLAALFGLREVRQALRIGLAVGVGIGAFALVVATHGFRVQDQAEHLLPVSDKTRAVVRAIDIAAVGTAGDTRVDAACTLERRRLDALAKAVGERPTEIRSVARQRESWAARCDDRARGRGAPDAIARRAAAREAGGSPVGGLPISGLPGDGSPVGGSLGGGSLGGGNGAARAINSPDRS